MAVDETPDLRLDRPSPARMYDHYLGGKDNYAVDREAAGKIIELYPPIVKVARRNRAFMRRATRWLVREAGIRQFLDIGTGIPTEPNLHQVVQEVAPECRVVYVDNDPVVLTHARALMRSTPEGRTTYIQADATRPETILGDPELAEVLDLSQPVALTLIALMHFVEDKHDPVGVVRELLSALPSGSALAMTHVTGEFDPVGSAQAVEIYRSRGIGFQMRSRAEGARFFEGLDLVEPGIELLHRWRPELGDDAETVNAREIADADDGFWAGVAVKP
ncbi:hypothetical protein SRB5_49720 [Streptomyces sp. RB5]|uniref:Methyltransferase n=1 Tax=Streptomyces smaragdinus TaxID=2585196 RepID=A0A7K0CMT8_9ACTN|nr:SAM-dependent methyltransferase [Streptomyces smaragdinus]MQY14796.1 hypothetical protein [Streptomyces smaragdinus]